MSHYGLIGYPLKHSFSPAWFSGKFRKEGVDARYDGFPLPDIGELRELIERENLRGLNVTIPHKESVLPLLHRLDKHAAAIGAVNCIRVENDGTFTGYNTDWIGFGKSLWTWLNPLPTGALILGTGGASKAVAYALTKLGIPHKNVSRRGGPDAFSYPEISGNMLRHFPLLINTTPLGTWPEISGKPPLDYASLSAVNALYDLVYNPAKTAFMQEGLARGCRVKNGLEMLEIQAAESWKIWQEEVWQ